MIRCAYCWRPTDVAPICRDCAVKLDRVNRACRDSLRDGVSVGSADITVLELREQWVEQREQNLEQLRWQEHEEEAAYTRAVSAGVG